MSAANTVTLLQVDAFTERPFGGNPAAVCVLPEAAPDAWMQAVAAEMNLSETAFLCPQDGGYQLRWFTPTAEVDLCGHATLASAHVLWSKGYLPASQTICFETRSGTLTATYTDGWITLNFPAQPPQPVAATPELLKSLRGLQPAYTGRCGDRSNANLLVEVPSEAYVRSLQPDLGLMQTLPAQGVIVTAPAQAEAVDFVSRYFAPAVGIAEDPVTGSAHCSLAPYWQAKLGKADFLAQQLSARGGTLRVTCQSDRVLISGQAVTVLEGALYVAPTAEISA